MYRQRKVSVVIVAAGSSTRMGFDKLLYKIDGVEVLRRTIAAFEAHSYIDDLVVVAGENLPQVDEMLRTAPAMKPLTLVPGGATRADSVAAGVIACADASIVAVHDGARPFVSADVIARAIEAAAEYGAVAPAIPVKDTIKRAQRGLVLETLPRDQLCAVQTPQVFDRASFARALAATPAESRALYTDDCMIMERAGMPVHIIEGDEANIKITTPADLGGAAAGQEHAAQVAATAAPVGMPRIGHGYDVHKLVPGRKLILGGVEIPYHNGLLGHSDADVLLHAVSDALLGACALGDIGRHFPDTDPAYKGADSLHLLQAVGKLLLAEGYKAANVDATLLCQAPKLAPHIPGMRKNIANALRVEESAISVKATTEEGLGFTGSGQGIAAHCVVFLVSV